MAPTSSIGCRDVRDATLEDEGLGLFPRELGAPEVTVRCRLLVDRLLQVQIPVTATRTYVYMYATNTCMYRYATRFLEKLSQQGLGFAEARPRQI